MTQEDYAPQVGDECDVYRFDDFFWIEITEITDDGIIVAESRDSPWTFTFTDKEELFAAIGDV